MMHTLQEYVELLISANLFVETDMTDTSVSVRGLTFDSREVAEGFAFIVKGAHFKDEYLTSAMERGACVYFSESVVGETPSYVLVRDIRAAMAVLARMFYDAPDEKLTTIGITGTKGKSTTAYYMKDIIELYAARCGCGGCGYLSSIDTYDGKEKFESHLTTPESPEVYRHFANAVDAGLRYFVMEVSSQALKYHRVDGINYSVACYTNIGMDHISPLEHPDFDDYFTSKLRLFDSCRIACVNTDDEHSGKVLEHIGSRVPVITFGSHIGDTVYCDSIEKCGDATSFHVITPDFSGRFTLTMPGIFNVSNALAAIAMSIALGIPMGVVRDALLSARTGGRMQLYRSADGEVVVIVDYAHNYMSFKALYDSCEVEYPDAKLISVYGCPGKKALLRRHDLGKISGERCAHVIITEEDSGEEPFDSIAADIASHVSPDCPLEIIEDRGSAIKRAVMLDIGKRVILVTGKGEETRQKRGLEYIDCPSDVDYTLKALEEYNGERVAVANI